MARRIYGERDGWSKGNQQKDQGLNQRMKQMNAPAVEAVENVTVLWKERGNKI